jgi:hypothetical protein
LDLAPKTSLRPTKQFQNIVLEVDPTEGLVEDNLHPERLQLASGVLLKPETSRFGRKQFCCGSNSFRRAIAVQQRSCWLHLRLATGSHIRKGSRAKQCSYSFIQNRLALRTGEMRTPYNELRIVVAARTARRP